MNNTKVTLTINTTEEGDRPNQSTTIIQADSLEEIQRMLELAGVPKDNIENVGVEEDLEPYKPSADLKVRMPNQKLNNPRFGDNSLDETIGYHPEMTPQDIVDMYFNFLAVSDHDEAVANVADEVGITGEEVEEIVQNHVNDFANKKEFSEDFNDYNQVEPKEEPPAPAKGFKDYLSDLGAEREVKHEEQKFTVKIEWLDAAYNTQITEVVVAAGTSKEAEQKAIADLRTKNGGKLNLIDSEVELSEANELIVSKNGEISGTFKDNMDYKTAKSYIESYPNGVLLNNAFEQNSFVFLTKHGEWKFYHSVKDIVEPWNWKQDLKDICDSYNGDVRDVKAFLNGFWYEPADEFFPEVKGNMEFWDEIVNETTCSSKDLPENEDRDLHYVKQVLTELVSSNPELTVDETLEELKNSFAYENDYQDAIYANQGELWSFIEELKMVGEAFGYRKSKWEQKELERQYKHVASLLPVPGMYSLETLGTHEYYGDDLLKGNGAYVVMKIETGSSPRYTFCATAGDVSDWHAGDSVLTFHDQTGKERPGEVITAFTAAEWNDPVGRMNIAKRMAKGGMDPNRKYSVRTFK